jgi:hypothetical protein
MGWEVLPAVLVTDDYAVWYNTLFPEPRRSVL